MISYVPKHHTMKVYEYKGRGCDDPPILDFYIS
jgi:hypothetical protein